MTKEQLDLLLGYIELFVESRIMVYHNIECMHVVKKSNNLKKELYDSLEKI